MTPPDAPGRRMSPLLGEGLRMGVLSVASLAVGYLLTTGLVELAQLAPEPAYAIAVVSCSILNFFGCRHYVFKGTQGPLWKEASMFFPSVLAFRALEVLVFSSLLRVLDHYQVVYFVTAGLSMVAKFIVSKLLIFRR
ncbi:GtrA family protein [Luteimonas marina]|uniref:GtrA family protein n=1 Tax=Luteimonas marina TaxID=488485 RepID=A0A5C5TZ98_9GAMM|nr:GtrA family protein [Luteimonas marina]TWT18625.1 GtrA family protein [Luteimonas marina]